MSNPKSRILLLLLFLLAPRPAAAEWQTGGVKLADLAMARDPAAAPDGAGGIFAGWREGGQRVEVVSQRARDPRRRPVHEQRDVVARPDVESQQREVDAARPVDPVLPAGGAQ